MQSLLRSLFCRAPIKTFSSLFAGLITFMMVVIFAQTGMGQRAHTPVPQLAQAEPPSPVLFENVRIFDGVSEQLSDPANVLVVDNKIQTISTDTIPGPSEGELARIKGNGRTLMPGLIDAHSHLFMTETPLQELFSESFEVLNETAKVAAENMLMQGFTSERDLGGPVFALKQAIDAGEVVGPRIWPSGAMVSQTSGHGDFRNPATDLPRTSTSALSHAEELGISVIADGVPEVLRSVREQLMKGASQIKVMAGGGTASDFDPLDVAQYTEAELEAIVEATADWNTYVAVHAYTPRAVQKAIRAGVKCIDHGQLIDEETARIMAENDVWLSAQPFVLSDEIRIPFPEDSENYLTALKTIEGTDKAYRLAKQYNIKTAFGIDNLLDAENAAKLGVRLVDLTNWYTPAEALKMATSTNAELLALSGPRNPYPGKLGVVEEGALADLLLVDGNPLENIDLVADPKNNFVVIMKDGKIYKNSLS